MPDLPPTTESGKKLENAASGIAGCDAVWPYDPTAAYFGMKEWAELLVAERERDKELLKGCLAYFRGYDMERTDGKTSPIIPELEDALRA